MMALLDHHRKTSGEKVEKADDFILAEIAPIFSHKNTLVLTNSVGAAAYLGNNFIFQYLMTEITTVSSEIAEAALNKECKVVRMTDA